MDKDQEDRNTESSKTNILDTPSINVRESADANGRLIAELSRSEHALNHDVSGERRMIEHIDVVGAARQMSTTLAGLEEVTSPRKK